MQRMPIKAILIEGQGITSSGGLKTQPIIWLSSVWALSLLDKAQHGLLPKLLYKETFHASKMVVQLEPFSSIRTVRFHRVIGPTVDLGSS